jgi:hypothetical protein
MNYKRFKEERRGLVKKCEYHQQQVGYHGSSLAATRQLLLELDKTHSHYRNQLHEEGVLANRKATEEVETEIRVDREELKRRVEQRKAQSLYEAMLRNFE